MGAKKSTRREALGTMAAAGATVGVGWCCGDHVIGALEPALDRSDGSGGAEPTTTRRSPLAVQVAPGLSIHPRSEWGDDLPPRGPIKGDDVRFLLIHHTATDVAAHDPRRVIRSVYAFHTGTQKRWPDVAYHFFVAPDGSVWEGRAGSLDGPVEASATGGNQGFAQLVCLIGNHVTRPPTAAAQDSLVRVLAWLADRYRLGVHRSASATFVSRGSNRYPAGNT
ncbi:MAG: N-acetylmuramoyl-L-alanine amidase, partial [Actinomycetota bacterium]